MWPGPTRARRCGPGAESGVGLSPYAVGSHTEVPKPGEVVHSTALPAEQSGNTHPEKSTGKLLVRGVERGEQGLCWLVSQQTSLNCI